MLNNVRASTVKRKLFSVQTEEEGLAFFQTEEERLAFQQKMGRYIENTIINFESTWYFDLCGEQRPVDSAFQWEVSDQRDEPFIYRNSIINAGVLLRAVFRHEKIVFFKGEILPKPVQLRLLSVKG